MNQNLTKKMLDKPSHSIFGSNSVKSILGNFHIEIFLDRKLECNPKCSSNAVSRQNLRSRGRSFDSRVCIWRFCDTPPPPLIHCALHVTWYRKNEATKLPQHQTCNFKPIVEFCPYRNAYIYGIDIRACAKMHLQRTYEYNNSIIRTGRDVKTGSSSPHKRTIPSSAAACFLLCAAPKYKKSLPYQFSETLVFRCSLGCLYVLSVSCRAAS